MTIAGIRHLFAYTEWANDRVIAVVESLPAGPFTREIGGSFPSIQATLAHMVSVEWLWLERCRGGNPRTMPDWAAAPDVVTLRNRLREVEQARAAWLGGLTDADLDLTLSYTNFRGEAARYGLRHVLPHVVNHATYHRGQVVNMLRIAGATVPATDFLYFTPAPR